VGDAARRFRITHNSEGDTVKNHTPGPWEAHENGHIYAEERANAVARIFENYYHRDGEANANARLIAAAYCSAHGRDRALSLLRQDASSISGASMERAGRGA